MANNTVKYFILTGEPGVGKTTLVKKLSTLIGSKAVRITGFYTEEVRKHGSRLGFDVVTFNGERGQLARESNSLAASTQYKVGKYGVLLQEFEKVALPCLQVTDSDPKHIVIIDEIGKMECFSTKFKTRVEELFRPVSNVTVLATIPIRKSDPLIESIRNNNRAKVWQVTRENRNSISEEIIEQMSDILI